jgi:hypothetical protein
MDNWLYIEYILIAYITTCFWYVFTSNKQVCQHSAEQLIDTVADTSECG